MALASAVLFLAPTLAGAQELGLALLPVLLIVGLLSSGRYVGEAAILARRRAPYAPRRRAPRRLPRPAPMRPLASLLERRPRLERGPPAVFALTA